MSFLLQNILEELNLCYIYNMDDNEIIEICKSGNKEIFKELIEKYSSSIFNFVAHMTRKIEATDITQDIFIKAWKNLYKYNHEKSSFKTWLFTIAKNTAIDFLKKKKNITFADLNIDENEDFSENIKDENPLPDQVLEKLEQSALLNNLINELPIHYKNVLILHYQEEMTFLEIGKILEKPLNTVKSYHRRAILYLRKKLN